jgi:hypothetical protein
MEQPYQPKFTGIPHTLAVIFISIPTILTLREEWCIVSLTLTLCTGKQEYAKVVVKIRQDLATSGYPQHIIDSVLKRSEAKSRQETDETRLSAVVIPYVKGISEKLRRIGERYNIKTVFKTKQTLRSFLTRTRPNREVQGMRQCI